MLQQLLDVDVFPAHTSLTTAVSNPTKLKRQKTGGQGEKLDEAQTESYGFLDCKRRTLFLVVGGGSTAG
jgi:hypothetical protein